MIALRRFEMTPYRMRIAFNLFTGFVIVTVAFALAGLTWRLAGHAGTGAITVPSSSRPVPVPDLAPALALAPFGRGVATDAAQPTTLTVELKGIVFARPESLSSAFIAANGEAAKPFKVGDAILSATVETIRMNRVLLRNGGRVEFLAFPDPFAKAQAAAATPANIATGRPPGALPPMRPSTAPPPLASIPSPNGTPTTADLMAKFDARPVSGGYQVGANAPTGMQPGDVLQTVNGTTLGNPDMARDAFAKAQTAGTAQIQILRDGKNLTLTVPIR